MFNWLKKEINECRSWKCDRYCVGCNIERFNENNYITNCKKCPKVVKFTKPFVKLLKPQDARLKRAGTKIY